MLYRNLTTEEITALENQNCQAIDGWNQIQVDLNFKSSHLKNVTFSGKNSLGVFSKKINLYSGVNDFSGIYNAHLHNCTINNECYIKNIGTVISNYEIREAVIIHNVDTIYVDGESSFGNGVEVSPVNEAGGREIKIYDDLSVHTAYILAFYRHRPKLIENINKAIDEITHSAISTHGTIGKNTSILNCGSIKNIKIGEHAQIEGIQQLNNGSINSTSSAPTFIGHGVNAKNFIVSSGSIVSDGAHIQQCFIGQGCEISNSFTAENSLFFANSQCLQGEACSIFAGPHTVTHHKSSLLIAGYYSFFNAGSGTNQSNHMYKLGPVHQGIIERGGKTGSDSYVLWPAQIGAFTMILGRHYGNPDISQLPFSYLIEDSGKSVLMPAQNIFNVGVTRDAQKWPNRDNRKGDKHLDYLISETLNPFTVEKIKQGIEILKQLQAKASPQGKNVMYKNTQISLTLIKRGIKLYEQALVKYVGDELVAVVKQTNFDSIRKSYNKDKKQWIDLAGLICNTTSLDQYIEDIEYNKIQINEWDSFYKTQYQHYPNHKRNHALGVLKGYFDIDITSSSTQIIAGFIKGWVENNTSIKNAIIIDAKKEFNIKTKIGFGIDGDSDCREKDFDAVRGNLDNNLFVKELKQEYENKNQEAEIIINKLDK